MKTYDTNAANFNFLFTKILNEHVTKRDRDVIAKELNNELKRLAKAFIEDRVHKSSYQVLKLTCGGRRPNSRHVDIRSRLGYTIRINSSNIEDFKTWAFCVMHSKGIVQVKVGKLVGTWNERTSNPDEERLNIRHGNK